MSRVLDRGRSSAAIAALGLLAAGALPALAADPSAAPPAPICGPGEPPAWVTSAHHPNDGVPDPEGRIVFGAYIRTDIMDQLVSLYAVDPDGSDLVQLLDCEVTRPRFPVAGVTITAGGFGEVAATPGVMGGCSDVP